MPIGDGNARKMEQPKLHSVQLPEPKQGSHKKELENK
jgi:hypothetical protein